MKRDTSLLLLVVLFSVAAGCNAVKIRRLPDGRAMPVSFDKAPIKSPGQARAARALRYDAVYLMEPFDHRPFISGTSNTYRGEDDFEMSWYRFWPGGQVLDKPRYGAQPDRTAPTAAEADDFSGRTTGCGRYSVVGDELTIAFVGFTEAGPKWSKLRGRVNEDGSVTLEHYGTAAVLRPHVVEGLTRSPDW